VAPYRLTIALVGLLLRDEGFLVNSAYPGFVNTDMGGPMGATKPVRGRCGGNRVAGHAPGRRPTGGFFRDGNHVTY
jgi:NAD(P)-dependent dehydrogenase (short-subunit alcohol dehydrogenase family)